jgi:RHS repeat-associated protein
MMTTTGGVSYTYDSKGNTGTETDGSGTVIYGYDCENRLISVQSAGVTAEYVYDADGIRVRSVANGAVTNYVVDKNRDYAQVLEEKDGAGSPVVSYVYGDDLISQNRGGSVSYYHYDGLGSTRSLTNEAGNVTDTYTYEAFGGLLNSSGITENRYLFTGEQYDANAGFYYLRARYYDVNTGRFISSDTWQGNTAEPVTLHKYLYANMNPVMYIDPAGLFTIIELNNVQGIMSDSKKKEGISAGKTFQWIKRPIVEIYLGTSKSVDKLGLLNKLKIGHMFIYANFKKLNIGFRYDVSLSKSSMNKFVGSGAFSNAFKIYSGLIMKRTTRLKAVEKTSLILKKMVTLSRFQYLSWDFMVRSRPFSENFQEAYTLNPFIPGGTSCWKWTAEALGMAFAVKLLPI